MIGLKIEAKLGKQNESNKCMRIGCIQIRSRNTTVEREWIKRCGHKIKKKNVNVWNGTPKEQCGQIVHKGERGTQRSESMECCIREEENSLGFYAASSKENLIRGVAASETFNTEDTVTSGEFKKQEAP